jgi:oxygen-dependent protoporphyrinogen oxidase
MIPRVEKQRLLGCTWASNKFPHRSEEGLFLSRLFVAGAQADAWMGLTDEELVEAARAESDKLTGVSTRPVATWVTRWPKGNPQYEVGHASWLDKLERETARIPGLHLTGSSYRGGSMSDCVKDANATALKVADFLTAG